MAEKKANNNVGGIASTEESYRLAKLLRMGSREYDRQINAKKSKKTR